MDVCLHPIKAIVVLHAVKRTRTHMCEHSPRSTAMPVHTWERDKDTEVLAHGHPGRRGTHLRGCEHTGK